MKQEGPHPVTLRPATPEDYAAFVRLFPQLGTGDPIPALDTWESAMAPTTWVAARHGEVVAYCYAQEYTDTGYVRSIVVDAAVRRQGVGRMLLSATAERLRAHGKTAWRLNVRPDNVAAIALYTELGLQMRYSAKSFRLPWAALPVVPSSGAAVRAVTEDRDATVEDRFSLPRGQLTESRRIGRTLFEAVAADGRSDGSDGSVLGLSVFNPKFPGAFPFRVVDPQVTGDLLAAMRAMVPDHQSVNLVTEDDEALATLLLQAGAVFNLEIAHMTGAL